eukprot:gene5197-26191_t
MSFQWALQNAATSPSGYGAGAASKTKREAATKAAKVKSRSTVTFKSKKRDVLIACIRAGKQNVAVRVKRNADGRLNSNCQRMYDPPPQ